ncbi:MAG: dissimilatory-type sulfite reductase subunit alpha [bacterium]|nr:dissimilatory-type sulfite reductase subunit alpha [bacterium]
MSETPLLDELEKGQWPSFVSEIKKSAKKNKKAEGLLGQLELSYKEKKTHWKHGGIVGVRGYGGGVIGRFSDVGEEFPGAAHFHTIRVNQTAGFFYTAEALRKICDIWDRHGSGLTNLHGSTGDLVLLGADTDSLEDIFCELSKEGWDLGGSGGGVRTPSCCVGPARCEFSCYDTLALNQDITMTYQDELHRPSFAYKWKFKFSGCPNDCVAAIARSDFAVIGTWRDDIQIDQDAAAEYVQNGLDIQTDLLAKCPTRCIEWDGSLRINNPDCTKCMHCINVMPKALRPGKDKGACILMGAKAPIVQGALLASVIVPFIRLQPPYDEIKGIIKKIWEFWDENGVARERIGECIQRVGLGNFLEAIGVEISPQVVTQPRDNPYIFYEEYYEEEGGEG